MNIDDYAKGARETAIYPDACSFVYPALGLCGEVGETVDKLFPTPANEMAPSIMTEECIDEIGDCVWYIVNVALDLSIPFRDVIGSLTGGLHAATFADAAFQRLKVRDRRSPYLRLTVYSGSIAEIAKKSLRDSKGVVSSDKKALVREYLAQILVAIFEICERHGINPNNVARRNLDKLQSRKERGKLQGDGDKR